MYPKYLAASKRQPRKSSWCSLAWDRGNFEVVFCYYGATGVQ
ncbi:hypothetical protein Mal15_65040 [Stieleria maiorica]|uniref:Uncharacterized protein n=1 Tax=Stieleria maiorica TaxID=2795974 RepID=A0A5B9MM58_9BACT|nr:hypothetical protein Mal15_65040 [Stieleria maiorica]